MHQHTVGTRFRLLGLVGQLYAGMDLKKHY